MANFGGFGPPQTGFSQPGAFPQAGGYPPQQPGGYPPSSGFSQQPGGFPPQQPGGYPPQQGGYPPQQPGGYPPQQPGGYPPQQPGFGGPASVDPIIYQWFQTVDTDKTGRINAVELQRALTNANWTKFNFETCRLMIAMFDRDGSKQIDFTGFQGLWAYIHQWKGIFDQFDRDRSGFIDVNELANALNQMGLRVQPQLCQGIIAKYDYTNGQRLSLDNFIQVSALLKSMTDQFKARDLGAQGSIQIRYDDFLNAVILNKF